MPNTILGAAALNTTPLDWQGNRRCIVAALHAAREAGVRVLCLPELCVTGYGCEDMFFAAGVRETAWELVQEILPETHGLFTSLGLPVEFEGAIYNGVAVISDGKLLGVVCKQHLAGDGIHYEPRWFRPWPAGKVASMEIDGTGIPLGDLVFSNDKLVIGFEICRDAWVEDRPLKRLVERGTNLILNPSASHFAFDKQAIREEFVLEATRGEVSDNGVSYAYANLLGNESGRSIYDGGTLLASGGEIVARGPRFSFADVVLTTVVIEPPANRSVPDDVPDDGGRVQFGRVQFTLDTSSPKSASVGKLSSSAWVVPSDDSAKPLAAIHAPAGHPDWDNDLAADPESLKREEFTRAVPLGLFDYLRKSRAQGCVVSLSGGADSSATALMVRLFVEFAAGEIGFNGLARKLAHVSDKPTDAPAGETKAWVGRLLNCVYQSTANSGPVTHQAAEAVADAIGAQFFEWSVETSVNEYVETVSNAIGRPLDWQHDDHALQNIQARARGPGAWLLANLRGALLLTTSNRSEAAVGYATMDGDTCGGLAPIAGIDKAFLRDWLVWMETTGPAGGQPIPVLRLVNQQEPTAELRPPGAGQTDETDLMPYRVLDAIERAAIRDKQMPLQVFHTVGEQFSQYPPTQIAAWIERFFKLWCQNQWKRERYAPSFHLDDENLDPKTWCRFPILSGGFERELEQLRNHIK